MSMTQTDLIIELKASLNDAVSVFNAANEGDFIRFLNIAALDLSRFRKRTLKASVILVANQSEYAAPADMVMPKFSSWGVAALQSYKPWEANWPGRLPRLSRMGDALNTMLVLTPAPSQQQIGTLGSTFDFYYFARHIIGDGVNVITTVRQEDRALLLLRAQAEAMKEMSVRNIKKPVQMRDGLNASPKNMTPSALYASLMASFVEQASC